MVVNSIWFDSSIGLFFLFKKNQNTLFKFVRKKTYTISIRRNGQNDRKQLHRKHQYNNKIPKHVPSRAWHRAARFNLLRVMITLTFMEVTMLK